MIGDANADLISAYRALAIDPGRVHQLRPSWFLGRTVGAGHFHHLLVPDQVNGMIQRFLDCLDSGFGEAAPSEW